MDKKRWQNQNGFMVPRVTKNGRFKRNASLECARDGCSKARKDNGSYCRECYNELQKVYNRRSIQKRIERVRREAYTRCAEIARKFTHSGESIAQEIELERDNQ